MKSGELRRLWERRLAEYKTSGKTITAWCRDNAVTESQYHYWRRKIESQKDQQMVKWIAIDPDATPQEEIFPEPIAIHIRQVTIEVKKGFDRELLQDVIKVLKTL